MGVFVLALAVAGAALLFTFAAVAILFKILVRLILLPLLLVTFVIKYGFETALAVAPGLSSNAGFSAAYLLLSGGFTGIFIGKYCRYLAASRRATPSGMQPAG